MTEKKVPGRIFLLGKGLFFTKGQVRVLRGIVGFMGLPENSGGGIGVFGLKRKRSFTASRGRKGERAEQDKIALKRSADFLQAIHIFFSSKKNVNRLRKVPELQMPCLFH